MICNKDKNRLLQLMREDPYERSRPIADIAKELDLNVGVVLSMAREMEKDVYLTIDWIHVEIKVTVKITNLGRFFIDGSGYPTGIKEIINNILKYPSIILSIVIIVITIWNMYLTFHKSKEQLLIDRNISQLQDQVIELQKGYDSLNQTLIFPDSTDQKSE